MPRQSSLISRPVIFLIFNSYQFYFIAYFNSNFLVSYQWITVFALYPACFLVAKAVQLLIREFYKTPLFQKIEGFFLS